MFAGHLLLLVEGQAVGVVELEGKAAGDGAAIERADGIVEDLLGDEEGGGVAVLFVLDHAGDAGHALHHLGIGGLHELGNEAGHPIKESVLDAD